MDLFIQEPQLTFESPKVAMVQLDEDTQSWARQVLVELYRQMPEVSEYTPQVMFSKVDEEQGVALGVVVISSATDSALSAVRPGSKAKSVFVPVLVKNHQLCPLDLIMTPQGKMMPLTAQRLRQSLFRPATFEMVTDDWGDTTLYNMFYPPGRSDNDFGAGISQGVGGGTQGAVTFVQGPGMKLSSEKRSFLMLESVAPTMLGPDLQRLSEELDRTPGLVKAATSNDVFLDALQLLAEAEGGALSDPTPLFKTAAALMDRHVVQVGYSELHQAYWVKSASRDAFYHEDPELLSRGEALKKVGEAVVHKVDTDGTVTMSADDSDATTGASDASRWAPVEEPGIYKVKTVHGKELTGWVLPDLLALDGTHVPMTVFTNGSQAMVQDQVVGARVATGVDLPSGAAKGTGVFYCAGAGGVMATVPLLVSGGEGEMNGGQSYLVRTLTGEATKVRLVPGLKGIKALGNEFHMPDTARFLPLNDEGMVPLVSQVDQLTKTSADFLAPKAYLSGGGLDEVTLRFENLPKLASQFDRRLDTETAVFALCAAGVPVQEAYTKTKLAMQGQPVTFTGLADVCLAHDIINESRKVAADRSADVMALRRFLTKEATTLPDVMTIDSVLSLGFINSENVRMFVNRIPYLEKCLSMICEMLLASRLGLSEIPEHATGRCVRAMEETIQGLRALSMREVEEGGVRKT